MASGYSYNGWPANSDPSVIGVVQSQVFPGGVKTGDVTTVLGYVARQFDARVEPVVGGWCWGYTYKQNVNNPSSLSCHASGTAIDANAPDHANGSSGTFTDAQVGEIYAILDEVQGAVSWLEGYDEMHFEICVDAADLARVAATLPGSSTPPTDWFDDVTKDEMQQMLDAALAPIKTQLTQVQSSADLSNWGINDPSAGARFMIADNTDLTNKALASADLASWGVNDPVYGTRQGIALVDAKVSGLEPQSIEPAPAAPAAEAVVVQPTPTQ